MLSVHFLKNQIHHCKTTTAAVSVRSVLAAWGGGEVGRWGLRLLLSALLSSVGLGLLCDIIHPRALRSGFVPRERSSRAQQLPKNTPVAPPLRPVDRGFHSFTPVFFFFFGWGVDFFVANKVSQV